MTLNKQSIITKIRCAKVCDYGNYSVFITNHSTFLKKAKYNLTR